MTIDEFLQRLDRVTKRGAQRWTSRCPAHEDKSPSLSIRESPNGHILLYCFGGCGAADVLDSLGLSFKDLFQSGGTSISDSGTSSSRIPVSDIIPFIDHELLTCALIMNEILQGRSATMEQWQRFAKAAARIGKVRDYLYPARPKDRSNGGA